MATDESGADALAPRDAETIRAWAADLKTGIQIDLVRVANDPALAEIEAFAAALASEAPGVRIRRDGDSDVSRSGLRIAPNLIFHAAPRGTELPVFLNALVRVADMAPPELTVDQVRVVGNIGVPAKLDLYVSPHCPFCPVMVSRLISLALASPQILLAVIDAGLFADAARTREIRSVPTLVLDDRLRWTGEAAIDEILPAVTTRDPAQLGPAVFRRMLESGAAGDLAGMMVDAGRIFPALLDLLLHARWSVRLGAMVVLETLAEDAPELAARVVPELMARFSAQSPAVRGDMLQMIATVGSADLIGPLTALVRDEPDAEVREAAADAIAALRP